MNITQIEHFMALARCGSFSGAADELLIAQPTLSRSISSLENELGVILFVRKYRSVTLTMEGSRFYDFFCKTKEEFEELCRDIHPAEEKSLSIGIMDGLALPILNKSLREFRTAGGMDIKFSFSPARQIMDQLKRDQFDTIIITEWLLGPEDQLPSFVLDETPMKLYYNSQFYDDPGIDTFRDEVFIYSPVIQEDSSNFLGRLQASIFEMLGFHPTHQKVVQDFAVLQMELECGRGYTVLPEMNAVTLSNNLSCLKLDTRMKILLTCKEQALFEKLDPLFKIYWENQKNQVL